MPTQWQLASGASITPGQGYQWQTSPIPPELMIDQEAQRSSFGPLSWGWGGPTGTSRFDWETPGSGLEAYNVGNPIDTWDQFYTYANQPPPLPGLTAAGGLGAAALGVPGGTPISQVPGGGHTFMGLPVQYDQGGRQAYVTADPASSPLLRSMGNRSGSGYDSATGRLNVGNPTWRGQEPQAVQFVAEARKLFPNLDLGNLSSEQKVAVVDGVIRARQAKNQLPKGGLQVGPFNIHPAALLGGALGSMFPAGASGLIAGGIGGGATGGWKGALLGGGLGYLGSGGTIGGYGIQNVIPDFLKRPFQAGQTVAGLDNGGSMVDYFGRPNLSGVAQGGMSPGYLAPNLGSVGGFPPLPAPNLGSVAQGSLGSNFLTPGLVNAPGSIGVPGGNPLTPNLGGVAQTPASSSSWFNRLPAVGGAGAGVGAGSTLQNTAIAALPAPSTTTGTTDSSLLPFYNEFARMLGDQPGIAHKTRPGAYSNVLSQFAPRSLFGYG